MGHGELRGHALLLGAEAAHLLHVVLDLVDHVRGGEGEGAYLVVGELLFADAGRLAGVLRAAVVADVAGEGFDGQHQGTAQDRKHGDEAKSEGAARDGEGVEHLGAHRRLEARRAHGELDDPGGVAALVGNEHEIRVAVGGEGHGLHGFAGLHQPPEFVVALGI